MSFSPGTIVEIVGGDYDVGKRGLVLTARSTTDFIPVSVSFTITAYRLYKPQHLVEAKPLSRQRGFSLEEDLNPILCGLRPVPNWEPIEDIRAGLSIWAAWGGASAHSRVCHVRLPGSENTKWARVLLQHEQGGGLSGAGMMIVYQSAQYDQENKKQIGQGLIGYFTICKHEKVAGGGANPMRGWHPGSCAKCGLDMTVDSSD